jgi:hypothetical protein
MGKLGFRWPLALRPIDAEDLRVQVYKTLRRVWAGEGLGQGYQPVSIYVGPRRVWPGPECQNVLTQSLRGEPMPMLIG